MLVGDHLVHVQSLSREMLAPGDRVRLTFPPDRCIAVPIERDVEGTQTTHEPQLASSAGGVVA